MASQARILRDLIEAGEHFVAADTYSAITGKIVEHVGFKAAYLGGHACSAFHYAVPDNGVYSQVEQIAQASRIADVIKIPLIVDADTLGETVADAFHFTRRYVQTAVAGFHVEDEINPKHSAYAGVLTPIVEMQAKLEACLKARGASPFVIIARCDEMYPQSRGGGGGGSPEVAIVRGKAYAEAGADALVYPHLSAELSTHFSAQLPIPVMGMGLTLPDTICTLNTGWGWTGAAIYHLKTARELFDTGSITYPGTLEGKDQLIEQDVYDMLIADWCDKTGRQLRNS